MNTLLLPLVFVTVIGCSGPYVQDDLTNKITHDECELRNALIKAANIGKMMGKSLIEIRVDLIPAQLQPDHVIILEWAYDLGPDWGMYLSNCNE